MLGRMEVREIKMEKEALEQMEREIGIYTDGSCPVNKGAAKRQGRTGRGWQLEGARAGRISMGP